MYTLFVRSIGCSWIKKYSVTSTVKSTTPIHLHEKLEYQVQLAHSLASEQLTNIVLTLFSKIAWFCMLWWHFFAACAIFEICLSNRFMFCLLWNVCSFRCVCFSNCLFVILSSIDEKHGIRPTPTNFVDENRFCSLEIRDSIVGENTFREDDAGKSTNRRQAR